MIDPTIKSVYRFTNGMVACFDADGEQIPMYQGRYSEHEAAIHKACDSSVEFHLMNWNTKSDRKVSRELFFAN